MFFIRLLRFLTGYVVFTAKGGFPERFLNLCAGGGVPLWDVAATPDGLRACTAIKSYRRLRRPARKSGMRVRVESKRGLPFFLRRERRRAGLLAGAAAALALLALFSSMVWTVDVTGNERISAEELLEALDSLGVKQAVPRSRVDSQAVEKALLERFDSLSWAALNILGSRAVLEVRERVEPPEMLDSSAPCNIVAVRDGEILKIEAASGEPAVQPGSAVRKGDLLIGGVLESKYHIHYVHARGTVLARTAHSLQSVVPKQFTARVVASERLRYSLYVFGLRIPLGVAAKEYDEYTKNEAFLLYSGTPLPLGVIRERYTVFAEAAAVLSDERAALLALSSHYGRYLQALGEAEVLSFELELRQSNRFCTVRGVYKAQEDIGLEQPFEVEIN